MEVLYPRCAGLDVHAQTIVACVRVQTGRVVTYAHRMVATHTRGLLDLADWLTTQGVTHVAMEATGVYWKPVWHVLEGACALVLANAMHIRNIPGRKSDKNDAIAMKTSRRRFVTTLGTVAAGTAANAQRPGRIAGFDHVALPMRNTDAMLAFYRALGCQMTETTAAVSVHVSADQMINFHRPTLWQNATFTLKAPAATPPCGDLCFVWDGTAAALQTLLDGAKATVIEGPVSRQGGRRATGSSVYVRDPDGNLIEFIIYG